MSSQVEINTPLISKERNVGSLLHIGKKVLGGIENYLTSHDSPAIRRLDLTQNVVITVPDMNFKLQNADVHPGQLILNGLQGIATRQLVVPKMQVPSAAESV